MKHTKGPWSVGEDSELVAGCCTVETDSGSIAHVETWCMDGIVLRDEAEANAHLIAAAPELLEACHTILNRFGGHVRDYEEMTAGQKLAIERTVEAIRKAEGN